MSSSIKGPGILYVTSKIARADILDEKAYMKWYEDDHIAEIMQTSEIKSALRYKNVDPSVDKPFLVTYPMTDIAFTQGEEFKKIKVHSELLPGGGPIYDLADIDVRYYGLRQTYDPKGSSEPGTIKTVLTAGFELDDKVTEQEFDDWYRKEHLDEVAKVPGYLRTNRFELLYYRTNAQSRALKGLPARDADLEIAVPPKFMAIHEFSTEVLDQQALEKTAESEWSKRIISNSKTMETGAWNLKGSFGTGKFFH